MYYCESKINGGIMSPLLNNIIKKKVERAEVGHGSL